MSEGWLPQCSICKSAASLEECKTDEWGQAVHEDLLRSSNRRPRATSWSAFAPGSISSCLLACRGLVSASLDRRIFR
jgi:hypothetical protein